MKVFYEVKTNKSLNQVLIDLKKNLQLNSFGVLFELNFKDKIKEKGFYLEPNFIMLEVCNPKIASEILKENIEIGYILPCKVVVYEKNNDHYLGILKPTSLIELIDDSFVEIADEIEKVLMNVVNESA